MKQNFPTLIPIFPLSGVIYFPKTNLPLNIFEERYVSLVNDCMRTNKLMGMIQEKKNSNDVYNVGCLGKITDVKKSNDGRILINLNGLCRFEISKEIKNIKLYREFDVNYEKFLHNDSLNNKIDTKKIVFLIEKAKKFFERNGLLLNWAELNKLEQTQQINTLSMIAPISNEEKQKLLETISMDEKIKVLSDIIEFYLYDKNLNSFAVQ